MLNLLTSFISTSLNKIKRDQLFAEAKSFYDAGEFKKALPSMQEAAEMGSPDAVVYLGVMCMKGTGIATDWSKAAELFDMAIKVYKYQGSEFSTALINSNLGLMYGVGGYGLKRDFDKARQYLQQAIQQGEEKSTQILQMIDTKKGAFGKKPVARPDIRW